MEENSERVAELQRRVSQLESRLQEVGQQSKEDWEAMEAQLKVIFQYGDFQQTYFLLPQVLQKEAEEQGRQMASVEPRAAELEQRVEEMQSKIQEKITLLVSRSEEHSTLIERSSSSVAMFSEKITSYEKEVKEVANSGSQGLDSFKQEVERKILELFDTTEDQGSQIESLTSNLGSVNDQSNRTLEDVVVTQAELAGMKKIVGEDHELIVRRVAEQKEAADLELASMSARFDRLEANTEHEVTDNSIQLQLIFASHPKLMQQCFLLLLLFIIILPLLILTIVTIMDSCEKWRKPDRGRSLLLSSAPVWRCFIISRMTTIMMILTMTLINLVVIMK